MKKILFILFLISSFYACRKEDKIAKSLSGVWQITNYNYNDTDRTATFGGMRYLNFLACKNAYTASCKCIYEQAYDDNRSKITDTILYEIKLKEIVFSGNTFTFNMKNDNTFIKNYVSDDVLATILNANQIRALRNDTDLYILPSSNSLKLSTAQKQKINKLQISYDSNYKLFLLNRYKFDFHNDNEVLFTKVDTLKATYLLNKTQ